MKKLTTVLLLAIIVVCISYAAMAENWQSFDGEGAAILEDVSVTNLSRLYMRLSPAGKLKVSYLNRTTGEEKLLIFEGIEVASAAAILFDQGQYDFYIETTSNWVAVVEPIKQIDTLSYISATVSYVSDMFPIDKPFIVKITARSERSCLFSLDLYIKEGDAWRLSDFATEFRKGNFNIQKIFTIEQPTMGIFVVDFPGEEWSLTAN
jgi:hypothetical protein